MKDTVQVEVMEDIPAQMDRLKPALWAAMFTKKPTIEAINTLMVDVNKTLEHQSSPPNCSSQNPDTTSSSPPTNKPNKLGPSMENQLRELLWT